MCSSQYWQQMSLASREKGVSALPRFRHHPGESGESRMDGEANLQMSYATAMSSRYLLLGDALASVRVAHVVVLDDTLLQLRWRETEDVVDATLRPTRTAAVLSRG